MDFAIVRDPCFLSFQRFSMLNLCLFISHQLSQFSFNSNQQLLIDFLPLEDVGILRATFGLFYLI